MGAPCTRFVRWSPARPTRRTLTPWRSPGSRAWSTTSPVNRPLPLLLSLPHIPLPLSFSSPSSCTFFPLRLTDLIQHLSDAPASTMRWRSSAHLIRHLPVLNARDMAGHWPPPPTPPRAPPRVVPQPRTYSSGRRRRRGHLARTGLRRTTWPKSPSCGRRTPPSRRGSCRGRSCSRRVTPFGTGSARSNPTTPSTPRSGSRTGSNGASNVPGKP